MMPKEEISEDLNIHLVIHMDPISVMTERNSRNLGLRSFSPKKI